MTVPATLALMATPALLAGCVMAAPVPVPPEQPAEPVADTCGSAAYQPYVGQQSPEITLPPGTIFRHYRTGDPVTMDFNPERINFEYDRSGRLVRVSCG